MSQNLLLFQRLLAKIAESDRTLARNRQFIAEQSDRIMRQETTGRVSTVSRQLLTAFFLCRDSHHIHRDRLVRELRQVAGSELSETLAGE